MFFGCEFIFDGIPSRNYDLRILNFGSGNSGENAGSETDVIQKEILRRPVPYYYGRTINKNLEFDFTIGSGDAISADMRSAIYRWLIGRSGYKPLRIVQPDMTGLNFNVMFTESQSEYIGNINYGMTLHAYCDSPWAYSNDYTKTLTYSGSALVNQNFTIMNTSDNDDYLYPSIAFTTSGIGTSFTVTNSSLSTLDTYAMTFNPLQAGETVTVDCDKQIILSSSGLRRMSSFNKWFFRMIPGANLINISGGITSFSMTYKFARKIGG